MKRLTIVLLTAATVSGCAASSVPWMHPSEPKSRWASDWSSCRRWAENQIGYSDSEGSSQFRDFDRAAAKRQADALAGSCMRDRGYVPAKSK
ncbi:MAG: hypothetical protein ACM33T_12490 [Solirubrobacterales bacterium]